MASCQQIRPFLFRTAEGEATPEETMRVARHLPDCTACRILLARERRLANWLEQDLEDLPVGEGFVAEVMANLPERPPAGNRRRARRGLKLAVVAGLIAAPAAAATRIAWIGTAASTAASLPAPDLETAGGSVAALLALVRVTLTLLQSAANHFPVDLAGGVHGAGSIAAGFAATAAVGFVAISSVLAFAAGSLLRATR